MHNKIVTPEPCLLEATVRFLAAPVAALHLKVPRGLCRRGKPGHICCPLEVARCGPPNAHRKGPVLMSAALKLEFAPFRTPPKGVLIVFCEEGLKFGSAARKALEPTGDLVARAAAADRFKGKNGSALDIVAPAGLEVSRLVVVGVGKARDLKAQRFREARRRRHGQGAVGGERGDRSSPTCRAAP